MNDPLFDPELDLTPEAKLPPRAPGPEPTDVWSKILSAQKGKPAQELISTRFSVWVAELSFPNTVGVGLAAGILASIPLVLAFSPRPEPHRRPVPTVAPPRHRAAVAPAPSVAPPPRVAPPVERVGLATVMDGARWTASSSAWRRTRLPDSRLIGAVYALLGELRQATDDVTLALPVGFGDAPPLPENVVGPPESPRNLDHVLQVAGDASAPSDGLGPTRTAATHNYGRLDGAILIAHGSVELGDVVDSVVIATGSVIAGSTTRSVVLAGQSVMVSQDADSLLAAGINVSVRMSFPSGGGMGALLPTMGSLPSAGGRVGIHEPGDAQGGRQLSMPATPYIAVYAAPECYIGGWGCSPTVVVNVAKLETGDARVGADKGSSWRVRRVEWPGLELGDEGRRRDDLLKRDATF